jgi:hypothetical protein
MDPDGADEVPISISSLSLFKLRLLCWEPTNVPLEFCKKFPIEVKSIVLGNYSLSPFYSYPYPIEPWQLEDGVKEFDELNALV